MEIDIKYYETFNEYPVPKVLNREIIELLKQKPEDQIETYLKALYELSIRKENIDLILDEVTLNRLDQMVRSCWDMNSLSNTELIIMIIFNFELKKAFYMLKDNYLKTPSLKVKKELEECFDDAKNSPPPVKYW